MASAQEIANMQSVLLALQDSVATLTAANASLLAEHNRLHKSCVNSHTELSARADDLEANKAAPPPAQGHEPREHFWNLEHKGSLKTFGGDRSGFKVWNCSGSTFPPIQLERRSTWADGPLWPIWSTLADQVHFGRSRPLWCRSGQLWSISSTLADQVHFGLSGPL